MSGGPGRAIAVARSAVLAHEDASARADRLALLLADIDAAQPGPSAAAARAGLDGSLGDAVAEWAAMGEAGPLGEVVLWANAFLFNRHMPLLL